MTANIYWRPVAASRHDISPGAPSSFIGKLEALFGPLPLSLTEESLPVLRAAKVVIDYQDQKDAFTELIDAIEKYERIEVWAEY